MGKTRSRENKKVRAAYAAIVPFVLAEVVILVAEYGGYETHKTFLAIVFGGAIVLAALVFVLMSSGSR